MTSRKINRPMVKFLTCTFCFFFATLAIATTSGITKPKHEYEITSEMFLNGTFISNQKFIVQENKLSTIVIRSEKQTEIKIELVTYDQKFPDSNERGIRMDIDFRYHKNEKHFHAQPQIIAVENKEALFEINDDEGGPTMKMKISAKRKFQTTI